MPCGLFPPIQPSYRPIPHPKEKKTEAGTASPTDTSPYLSTRPTPPIWCLPRSPGHLGPPTAGAWDTLRRSRPSGPQREG